MTHDNKKGREDVKPEKKQKVEEILGLIDKYPIVGVVNMENLPAKQLANMRGQLRGKVVLCMTKKKLIRLALEQCKKKNIKSLEEHVKGMPALLFTDSNPFALFKLLKKNRSKAFIKPGQQTPMEITVHAGVTSFAPGPVIGELGSMKIKAGIENGKVIIKEDKIVAKEGDTVDDKLASLLMRLGVEPMEIGLSLVAVYENGEIIGSKVLDIDEDAYKAQIQLAASESMNLAVFAAIPLADTIKMLLAKAHVEAKAVAKESKVMTSENVGEEFAKAEAEMNALKAAAKLE